ncbi:MAG: hypothetical protein ACE5FT_01765 [Candidatus Nanoarchaeia archaeon]
MEYEKTERSVSDFFKGLGVAALLGVGLAGVNVNHNGDGWLRKPSPGTIVTQPHIVERPPLTETTSVKAEVLENSYNNRSDEIVLEGGNARNFLYHARENKDLRKGVESLFFKHLAKKYNENSEEFKALDEVLIQNPDGPQAYDVLHGFAQDLAVQRLRPMKYEGEVKITLRHKRDGNLFSVAKMIIERNSPKQTYTFDMGYDAEGNERGDAIFEFPSEAVRGFDFTDNLKAYNAAIDILYGEERINPRILTSAFAEKERRSEDLARARLIELEIKRRQAKIAARNRVMRRRLNGR